MKIRMALFFIALLVLSPALLSCGNSEDLNADEVAVMETNYGTIVIEFYPKDAPRHVSNFKELARAGFYDGQKVFRVVKGKSGPVAIQAGDPNTISGDPSSWGFGQPGQETVSAEFSSTLKHVRGIVSAARKADDPDSATSQFFICASSYSQWDGQYSIFGHVIKGMNVVDAIARAPLFRNSDRPLDPVVIERVYIAGREEAANIAAP